MDNPSNNNDTPQPVTTDEETQTKQGSMVRQRLAVALLAVGGTLIAAAAFYWFYLRGNQ